LILIGISVPLLLDPIPSSIRILDHSKTPGFFLHPHCRKKKA
jgi:hypothetical protein